VTDREQGLRRVAIVTTGVAVAGIAGATLVACTVTDTSAATTTQQSTTDSQTQPDSGVVVPDDSGSAAHGQSGGS